MSRTLLVIASGLVLGCGSGGGSSSSSDNETTGVEQPKPVRTDPDAAAKAAVVLAPAPAIPAAPRGLPPTVPAPASNPTTPERVALGELLFFDGRLSENGSASCASCHDPDKGWSDAMAKGKTVKGQANLRHTPTLYNVGYAHELYWDGRVDTLETAVLANWQGQLGANPDRVAGRLARSRRYAAHFRRAFRGGPTPDRIVEALAAFVRTIRSGDSPWDQFEAGTDAPGTEDDVLAGAKLFKGKAQCGLCHPPPFYTDHAFHNIGVGFARGSRDKGRYEATGKDADIGAFKTPTMRGVADHPPYLHDGSAESLEAAVDFILAGGHTNNNPNLDPALQRVHLTPTERTQLLAFLRALSAPKTGLYPRPKLP